MRCSVCNYYSWSYFIAFGEIFISFHIARAFLHCARSTSFSQKLACDGVEPIIVLLVLYNLLSLLLIIGVTKRNEKLLQIYQTCTITLKASAIVRRIVLSATEYDGRNDGKTIIEIKLIIVFTLIFTLEALVVAGACRKMRREQQEQLYYIDVV
ncbi:uncharacterized protein LOC120893672 [Anopheles arabiensis]|uniref:Uncharacterized protein n=4 Tax=gambiae species complex TaxID=44542 RepID=A0A1S4GK48_ANOGA|nr:uncharacterized protein LOC120893672 [Anopheles arabiensis]XP_040228354.1 uncharacterized protein LOC120952873 [Anopheles coluzzii]XP_041762563.1 uncharacterized protein LOC121588559 [Anopheles merus]XP_061502773.1 uncharacterized protein LOC4577280 [Anopheles gambiae]